MPSQTSARSVTSIVSSILWLTAAHCIADIGGEGRYINGFPVEIIEADFPNDIAVLRLPDYTAGRELPMQASPPRFGQEIVIAGHPFGYGDIFLMRGYVANPFALIDDVPVHDF